MHCDENNYFRGRTKLEVLRYQQFDCGEYSVLREPDTESVERILAPLIPPPPEERKAR